ncbi:hypothetical protein NEUTE1DRAFT_54160 [Neurospora tetrasperma FGSC 2508]|uniref:Uncharacterized protein n=1 Tax=Neurospora tetrasperma (strain FGSC 2508 / ATCC MYA-4615 / P0657) TaxID=510951 RepID=F8MZB1_NEUT8|nr:uncharacterized protein NEUTE1DRAFT_54160 [Neurospora tetrasperma FGSC 2508]EGO52002.1 hypothetical protein NEUTE1DRAFT_54160 [Neurospora tetrasperma FGSC 2508]
MVTRGLPHNATHAVCHNGGMAKGLRLALGVPQGKYILKDGKGNSGALMPGDESKAGSSADRTIRTKLLAFVVPPFRPRSMGLLTSPVSPFNFETPKDTQGCSESSSTTPLLPGRGKGTKKPERMTYIIQHDDTLHVASSDWYFGHEALTVIYPPHISHAEDERDDQDYQSPSVILVYESDNEDGRSIAGADGMSSDSDSDSEYSGSQREHVSDVTTISVSTGGDFNDLVTQHSGLTLDVSFPSTVSERDLGSNMELGVLQPMVNAMLVPALDLTGATDVHSDDEDLGCTHAISGVACHCLTARNLDAVQDILKELRRVESRELRRHEATEWHHPRSEPDRRSDQAWEELTVDLLF